MVNADKSYEEDTLANVTKNQALVGILLLSKEGKVLSANPHLCNMLGYKCHEIQGKRIENILGEDYHSEDFDILSDILNGSIANYSSKRILKDAEGKCIPTRVTFSLAGKNHSDQIITVIEQNIGDIESSAELSQAKHSSSEIGDILTYSSTFMHQIDLQYKQQVRQEVVYNIAAVAGSNFDSIETLCRKIHQEINRVIEAENMHIALYDEQKQLISFLYTSDSKQQTDAFETRSPGNGLTEKVIQEKQTLWIGSDQSDAPIKYQEITTSYGTLPKNHLGVPLITNDKLIGVLGINSYHEEVIFQQEDLDFAEFVSGQIASILGKELILKDLAQKEEFFRVITENASDITMVFDKDGNISYSSPSISKYCGVDPDELIGRNIFSTVQHTEKGEIQNLVDQCKTGGQSAQKSFEFSCSEKRIWVEMVICNHLDNPAINGYILNARDISAKKAVERVLQNRNDQLARFAFIISHDLRAPVVNIQGLTALMELKGFKIDEEFIQMFQKTANTLDQITRSAISVLYDEISD